VSAGAPEGKPDLTLTISDDNFVKLVMGKMGPQQARRALSGSLTLALRAPGGRCAVARPGCAGADVPPLNMGWSGIYAAFKAQWSAAVDAGYLSQHAAAQGRRSDRERVWSAPAEHGRRAQAFLMRKLKIGGSMALALKLQPILDAAAPRAKL